MVTKLNSCSSIPRMLIRLAQNEVNIYANKIKSNL
jgi:hypothetical protein